MKTPTVAVIIPIADASGLVLQQLAALNEQTYEGPWELIISENAPSNLPDLTRIVTSRSVTRVSVVDSSAEPGAGYAREMAVASTSADFVLFCDADDIVTPKWIEAHVAALQRFPLTTGPLLRVAHHDLPPFRNLSGRDSSNDVWTPGPQQYCGIAVTTGCNFACRRSAIQQSGFATDYLSGEDTAMALRAHCAGNPTAWVPEARVFYRQRPNGRRGLSRALLDGAAVERLRREFARTIVGGEPRYGVRRFARLIVSLPGALRNPSITGRVWVQTLASIIGEQVERIAPEHINKRVATSRRKRHMNRGPHLGD